MCCLFGIMDYGNTLTQKRKHSILNVLATECEERGTDATGISYLKGNSIRIYKRPIAAHKLNLVVPHSSPLIMGHTRMQTQGDKRINKNNHPFPGKAGRDDFALAHNGVLLNDVTLRRSFNLPGTDIETDSYVAVQLIENYGELSFDSLKFMAEQLKGSFTFTVMDKKNALYIVKGSNPICLYHIPLLGCYLYASTGNILKKALSNAGLKKERFTKIPITDGDILKLNPDGTIEKSRFNFIDSYRWEDVFSGEDIAETDSEYLDLLKCYCPSFGVDPQTVDQLYSEGFIPEEIEEIISYPYRLEYYEYCSDF